MKKIILTSLIIFSSVFLMNTRVVYAQMGSMMGLDNNETEVIDEGHSESVEVVLQDILGQQSVSTVQDLDLAKVSDDEWERLGDAVMELQHPGEAHEVMDRMMGGEGSESLRQMHINMGQAYLGYGTGNSAYRPGGMMGGGMMNYGGYNILGTTTWILAIVFLASGTYFFLKKAHKK